LNYKRRQAFIVTLSFFERILFVKEPADLLGHFHDAKICVRCAKMQHILKLLQHFFKIFA